MTPYYDDGVVTIYHGDCREVLPELVKTVDLLLTDPPYGQNWQSSHRERPFDAIQGDDGSLDVAEVISLACKRLRRHRHVYVFGRPNLSGTPLTEAVELIWDKEQVGLGDLTLPWGPSHEPITFATYEYSAANRARGGGRLAARLRRGSVLRVPRPNAVAVQRHPTEKPVYLLRQLIESSSLIGETVLDPFIGVGSTAVAARLEGRRCIGIEIDERYCEIAAKRLTRDVLPLFEEAAG